MASGWGWGSGESTDLWWSPRSISATLSKSTDIYAPYRKRRKPCFSSFLLFYCTMYQCLEKVYWLPPVSHFFRPTFFTLAIAEATATHLSLTICICFGAGQFLYCHPLKPLWVSLSHPEAGDWKQVDNYVHVHSLEFWDSFFTAFQNTDPRLSTDNQLDNSPLNWLPSFLLHPHPCSWTSLSKMYYSHAGHCLALLWGTQARSDEYGTWKAWRIIWNAIY